MFFGLNHNIKVEFNNKLNCPRHIRIIALELSKNEVVKYSPRRWAYFVKVWHELIWNSFFLNKYNSKNLSGVRCHDNYTMLALSFDLNIVIMNTVT